MPVSEARRIALVLHDFPAGGTERIAVRLANAWAAAGREVTIFCGTTAGPAFAAVEPGVRCVAAEPAIPRGPLSRLRLGRWLRGRIHAARPDVVVAPGNFHLPVLFAAGRLPCPTLLKISNPLRRPDRSSRGQWLARRGWRAMTAQVDHLVAMSQALRDEAEQVLLRPCTVLAEPILPPGFAAERVAEETPLIVCAGRMVEQKRFRLALDAFARLAVPGAELAMLGDGPERAMLEAHADALGLSQRVRFIGHVPDIAPWLAHARAFLLTSRYEGYPAVLVEAIAAGVPVVTTPCSPALGEIVLATGGGVIAPADPAALAAALAQLLAWPGVDEAGRRRLVMRHEAGAAAAAWLAALDRFVAERRA